MTAPRDFAPFNLYQGPPSALSNALFNECDWLMEHTKSSLPETLKLPISLIKDYQASPLFDGMKKRMDDEREYKHALLKSIHTLIQVAARR